MPLRRWWQWSWDESNLKVGWGTCPHIFSSWPYIFGARCAQLFILVCAFLMDSTLWSVSCLPRGTTLSRAFVKLGQVPPCPIISAPLASEWLYSERGFDELSFREWNLYKRNGYGITKRLRIFTCTVCSKQYRERSVCEVGVLLLRNHNKRECSVWMLFVHKLDSARLNAKTGVIQRCNRKGIESNVLDKVCPLHRSASDRVIQNCIIIFGGALHPNYLHVTQRMQLVTYWQLKWKNASRRIERQPASVGSST